MNEAPTVPRYMQIAEELEASIQRGEYSPGDLLPTEQALGRQCGVNRHTAARALNHLQGKGIAFRVTRRGTFVRPQRIDYHTQDPGSFSASVRQAGLTPCHRVLTITHQHADRQLSDAMCVRIGEPLIVFDRVSYANEVPLVYATKYFRESLFPGLAERVRSADSLRTLLAQRYDVGLHRARLIQSVVPAMGEVAEHLAVRSGIYLMKNSTLLALTDGTPAGWNDAFMVADALTMTHEFMEVNDERDRH
ncbi:GntR family transcriptional regulator [Nocardia sp. NPDC004711]